MLRRLGTILTCLALFLVAGGHWAVLQSVAWAGMLGDYSSRDGLVLAVKKTFSGDFPCDMCVKIGEQQKKQDQSPLAKLDKKADTFLAAVPAAGLRPRTPDRLLAIPEAAAPPELSFAPPQPVPIAA